MTAFEGRWPAQCQQRKILILVHCRAFVRGSRTNVIHVSGGWLAGDNHDRDVKRGGEHKRSNNILNMTGGLA